MGGLPVIFAVSFFAIVISRTEFARAQIIDFERAQPRSSSSHYYVTELYDANTGLTYPLRTEYDKAKTSTVKTWLSTTIYQKRTKSLGVSLLSDPGCVSKQRVELEITESEMLDDEYYAFSLYIHPQSAPPRNAVIFSQVWQNHDLRYQGGQYARFPPFSLVFYDSAYRWQVETANEQLAPSGLPTRLYKQTNKVYKSPTGLKKGAWHRFVVRFKPSVTRNGAMTVWLNGKKVVSQTNQRNFGYRVRDTVPKVLNSFITRVGAYRGRQKCVDNIPSTGKPLPKMHVFFDNVKVGSSYSAVANP